jgi:hypothetical protein
MRPILDADLFNRFIHRAPKDGQPEKYEDIRSGALEMAQYINQICPDSREKSLAITHLEEVVFWANAAIARHA